MRSRGRAARWAAIAGLVLAGAACRTDRAASECPLGQTSCAGACVSLQSDPASCGACGVACGPGEVCQAGACVSTCGAPLARCATSGGMRCVDTSRDPAHCGVCGGACGVAEVCSAGACVDPCGAAGWRLCGGRCRLVAVDDRHCGACGAACAAGEACSAGACVAAASAPRPNLLVSVTADDGIATQGSWMVPMLEAHGLRGSFFVILSRLDHPNGLSFTTDALRAMSRAGHEIGLHGLTHAVDLTTVTPPERIHREICDGRVALSARGFEVRSLAYPLGFSDATSQGLAEACGLTSARNVGNGAVGCPGCPAAETWPPRNRFAIRAPSSVKRPVDVARLQQYVTDAEVTGGWLILNFHHVVPAAVCTDTSTDCFPSEWFGAWLDWLVTREALGTVVRTVEQVMGGPVAPLVASGTPPVILGDMESHLAGAAALPDCWTLGGESAGTGWSIVPGRSGSAVQVRVSPWVAGTRTLIQSRGSTNTPDYRSCGTQVTPGLVHTFRCWVRSDVPVRLQLYANDDVTHEVAAWTRSGALAPSPSAWAQLSFTARVPATFNTVFFGPSVSEPCAGAGCVAGPGTATFEVDDCDAAVVGG